MVVIPVIVISKAVLTRPAVVPIPVDTLVVSVSDVDVSNLSSPYLTAWLPFFKFQDKKAMLKTAFNKGTVKLSYFTENKENVNVENNSYDPYKSYFLDSSFLNAEHCFNNTTINNFIKK